ncbi:hypothetical protein [Cryobacterium sp. BB307]|uniref:hypothetical protein n=1 Tax=Cryobacterium sp. BB307 TaxID=2716317 RepID=UPI0014451FBA|nr:hypothetical protein [Cryobacterium sp. BB307]
MGFRMRAVALTAVALLLAGCVPNEPTVTARPPAVDPVFASDEEALAAAVEAYERYLAVADEVRADGGADADRISSVVTTNQLPDELESFERLRELGLITRGLSMFDSAELQSMAPAKGGIAVTIYACYDASGIEVVDSVGSVSRPNPTRQLFELTFESDLTNEKHLLLARSAPWDQSQPC